MKRSVRLGITNGDLMLALTGEEVPPGAEPVEPREAMFWLRVAAPPAASSPVLHAISEIAEALGYPFNAATPFDDHAWVMATLESGFKDRRLRAFRLSNTQGGGKGPAPKPPKPPQPQPVKETVNPTIEPATLVVVVTKKAKDPASGKTEPYTHPKRQAITLKTDKSFDGTATFSCDKPDKVKFFTAKKDGTEIKIDGTANVFPPKKGPPWNPGASISSGVTIYVEGAGPSAALDDITLKLSLSGGSKTNGPDDKATVTSVEVTLDIHKSQPAAATAPALSQDDKVHAGRNLLVQNKAKQRHRAKLVIQQVKPAAFKGDLVLKAKNGHVDAFADEKTKVGEASALPFTVAADKIPAAGQVLWAEGASASDKMRDTGFVLGIKGVEDTADLVSATSVQLDLDICKRRKKKGKDPEVFSDEDKVKKGRYVHEQDAAKSHERAKLIVRKVKPDKFDGKIVLQALGAKVELYPDEDPAAAGGVIASPHEIDLKTEKNEEKVFWVQGKTVSGALFDSGYFLHLKDDPVGNSDVVMMTVVKLEITAKVPTTPSARGTFAVAAPRASHDFKSSSNAKKFADNAPTTLVQSTADIALEVKTTPAVPMPIEWSVEDNPGGKKEPKVTKKAKVTEATLATKAVGGFSIVAAAGDDGDAPVRWNIVLVGLTFKSSKVTRNQTNFTYRAGPWWSVSSGAFNVADPTVCAMHTSLKATFDAGGNAALDTYIDKVHAGIVNVLESTTAQSSYPAGRRERERILSPKPAANPVIAPATPGVDIGYPILDRGGAAGTRATGGSTIYLSSTRSVPPTGKKRTVETCDSPAVGFSTAHPGGGNVTANTGVNAFKIYLVAYSDDANFTYVAFGSGNWTADYSGTFTYPPPAGAAVWNRAASCGITGGAHLTAIKDGKPANTQRCEVRPPVYLDYIIDAR
ncbi:MAG: hypothetical protein R3F14_46380 [Polyangiaceae bacterium]